MINESINVIFWNDENEEEHIYNKTDINESINVIFWNNENEEEHNYKVGRLHM